jgi:hypothetical protein
VAIAAAPLVLLAPARADDCTVGSHAAAVRSALLPADASALLPANASAVADASARADTAAAADAGTGRRPATDPAGAEPDWRDAFRAAGPTPCPTDGLSNTPLGPTSDDSDNGLGTGRAIAITVAALALIGGGIALRRRAHGD